MFLAIVTAAVTFVAAALEPRLGAQHTVRRPIDGGPDAPIDLRTAEGARLVDAQWRYSDTSIVETPFNAPGADLRPSGKPIRTYDYIPKAGSAPFDDSAGRHLGQRPSLLRHDECRTLYLTAQTGLYRIRLNIPGSHAFSAPTH